MHTGINFPFRIPDVREVPDLLPQLTWHMDEPFGSTSIVGQWRVFELAA